MSEKIFNTRIQHKHDIEANWNKATNFIPKQGELIVYDPDENCSYQRIKIGDGITKINDLNFTKASGYVAQSEVPYDISLFWLDTDDDTIDGEKYPQSDWNAAEGEPGHVLNRTHYEGIGEVVLFDESVQYTPPRASKIAFKPEIGKKYSVLLNGVLYENLTAFVDDGYPTLGEAWNIDADDYIFAEYPFTIFDSGATPGFVNFQTEGTHALQIFGYEMVVHKLPSKFIHNPDMNASEGEDGYIKNRTHWEENSESILFDDTFNYIKLDTERSITLAKTLEAGKNYTVVFDGVVYNLVAKDDLWGDPYIGEWDESSGWWDFSTFPFGVCWVPEDEKHYIATNSVGYHTLRIAEVETIVHKIPDKYLPAPDWNAAEGEPGHVLNRTHYKIIETVFPETEIILDEGYFESEIEGKFPTEMNSYRVIWNGTPYTCELSKTEDGMYIIGDIEGDGSYPFTIVWGVAEVEENTWVTSLIIISNEAIEKVNVAIEKEIAVKIPVEYLPSSVDTYTIEIPENEWDDSTSTLDLSEPLDNFVMVLYNDGNVYVKIPLKQGDIVCPVKAKIIYWAWMATSESSSILVATIYQGIRIVTLTFSGTMLPPEFTPPTV